MFDELTQTITTLRRRIQSHGLHIGDYEKRTRVALIDPLLRALGWDVSDPALVEVETKTSNGWADYALLGPSQQPLIFVEAKKLKESEPPISQVVGYATEENTKGAHVRYCVCTNGDYWLLLDILSQNPVVMRTSISQGNEHKAALALLGLWRPSINEGVYTLPTNPVAVTHEPSSISPSHSKAPASPPSSGIGWRTLDSGLDSVGKPSPISLRLPDGTEVSIKRWRHVIIQTTTWLFKRGDLTPEKWQKPFGKRGRYLFSESEVNPGTAKPFHNPHAIDGGSRGSLCLETSLGNEDMLRFTSDILKRCGYSPSSVSLRLP